MLDYKTENFIHESEGMISCDYIQFGDYDNSCAVERANIRWLEQNNKIELLERGGYGFKKAWLLDNEENRELLESLENYPCFDDETVSEIESEIEQEYIQDNDDIWRATPEPTKSVLQELNLTVIIPEIYYRAKENLNLEFIVESGGNGYINIYNMVSEYNLLLCDKFPYIKTFSAIQEAIENIPKFPFDFYETAEDMLQHKTGTFQAMSETEKQLLQYCAELENIIGKLEV